jgi:transposase
MLGPPKLRCLDRPIGRPIEELVAKDHFYRFLDARLDLTFVRMWVQDCYAERGRPSIDPVVFFRLQLVMFFEGIRSERQLMRVVADRLGYDLDDPLPHHSSLTRIRQRLGLPIFARFFAHVVELCQQAGLVWGKELIFDATKVRANADVDSLVPRWYAAAKTHLDTLLAEGADEAVAPAAATTDHPEDPSLPDAQPDLHAAVEGGAVVEDEAANPSGPQHLPFPGTADQEQRLTQENQATWKLLDAHRLDPTRPASCSYQRITDLRVSTTDPDAAPMRAHLGDRTKPGYHDHYVVDGGKARIILAAFVTPADVMENTPMLDLLRRVRFRYQLHPARAIGDTTYGTVENIRALEDEGIRAYVPLPNFDERTPYFGASRFDYHPEQDEYRCPQGQPLRRLRAKYTDEVIIYRADAATCNSCPLKPKCTASSEGRQVRRSFHAAYLDRVRGYHQTAAYQKAMRKRAVWVEPLFGEAKEWHGLRQFRLRGLWKVNCEGLRIAAGQNLKRWLTRTGWGRRHGPAGSLALVGPRLLRRRGSAASWSTTYQPV